MLWLRLLLASFLLRHVAIARGKKINRTFLAKQVETGALVIYQTIFLLLCFLRKKIAMGGQFFFYLRSNCLFDLLIYLAKHCLFFGLEESWGQPQRPNFPSPWPTMLALSLDCSTAALTTPQRVLATWKLVELKMLDFSDRTRTGISILTSAADQWPKNSAYLKRNCLFYSKEDLKKYLNAMQSQVLLFDYDWSWFIDRYIFKPSSCFQII